MRLTLLPLVALLLTGCITHMPMHTDAHLGLPWAPNFDAAVAEASRTGKPILACLIAGEIAGPC